MEMSSFLWTQDEKVIFAPAFEIVAASSAPFAQAAPGFSAFYREFVRRYGKSFTTYLAGRMGAWRKASPKALELLPAYLADERNAEEPDFGAQFHSAPVQSSMLPPAIRFYVDGNGAYVSATVPPDIVDEPDRALELVFALLGDQPALSSGWAGLAVAWNESMTLPYGEPREQLRAWIKRYPGLGQGNNFAIYDRALHGIAHVNWLTVLGPELTAKVGGAQTLTSALAPEVTVHARAANVIIQAGPRPELGDVNRGQDLPLYRKVGRLLKDIRSTEPERWLDGPEDETEEWFARFDA